MSPRRFLTLYIPLAFFAGSPLAISVMLAPMKHAEQMMSLSHILMLAIVYAAVVVITWARGKEIGNGWITILPLLAFVSAMLPMLALMSIDVTGYPSPGDAIRAANSYTRALIDLDRWPIAFILNVACCVIGSSSVNPVRQVEPK